MSTHQLLVSMIGFAIGLVLAFPICWGAHKWFEYRDMTRVERAMRKLRKMEKKR